jgi:hypothetical protein
VSRGGAQRRLPPAALDERVLRGLAVHRHSNECVGFVKSPRLEIRVRPDDFSIRHDTTDWARLNAAWANTWNMELTAERQALRDLVVSGLVGLSAEATVRAAGGLPQFLAPGFGFNLNWVPMRVRLFVEDGRVVDAIGPG